MSITAANYRAKDKPIPSEPAAIKVQGPYCFFELMQWEHNFLLCLWIQVAYARTLTLAEIIGIDADRLIKW